MAVRKHLIDPSPTDVWAVLEGEHPYGRWVVGASDSRADEGNWPEKGSSLAHSLRLGPKEFASRTVVRRIDRPQTLELEADGGPLGTARIAFDIRPWGDKTLGAHETAR
ncbi:hypothetical protein JGS22_024790 [Streptomyces sp. P38-E01]|uniref:Polyketide cyclase n=1 Tax=Streptomyces tardus TaxID=2780544 RepID=A0A949JIT5_9ACTN|nr:hypothetical protein [Streptomyces tardus]MBU7600752.1 hypothetical protein [Streptomyces tardus]